MEIAIPDLLKLTFGGGGEAEGTGGKGRLNKNRIISASNKNYKDYKTGKSISRRLRRAT